MVKPLTIPIGVDANVYLEQLTENYGNMLRSQLNSEGQRLVSDAELPQRLASYKQELEKCLPKPNQQGYTPTSKEKHNSELRRQEQIRNANERKKSRFGNRTVQNEDGKWVSTNTKDAKHAREVETSKFGHRNGAVLDNIREQSHLSKRSFKSKFGTFFGKHPKAVKAGIAGLLVTLAFAGKAVYDACKDDKPAEPVDNSPKNPPEDSQKVAAADTTQPEKADTTAVKQDTVPADTTPIPVAPADTNDEEKVDEAKDKTQQDEKANELKEDDKADKAEDKKVDEPDDKKSEDKSGAVKDTDKTQNPEQKDDKKVDKDEKVDKKQDEKVDIKQEKPYEVQQGDCVWNIAKATLIEHGYQATPQQILKFVNQIVKDNNLEWKPKGDIEKYFVLIVPGQKLNIQFKEE